MAGTFDGASLKLFIDGELDALSKVSQAISVCRYPLRIGNCAFEPGPFFNGAIDEVLIVRRALDATEIKTIYEHGIRTWADVAPPNLSEKEKTFKK